MVHKTTKWHSTSKHHIGPMPKNPETKPKHNYANWAITQLFEMNCDLAELGGKNKGRWYKRFCILFQALVYHTK